MPPKAHGGSEEWMRRAHANLALARLHGTGVLLEDLCYQAQQAAEKALKALYIERGTAFPFTHDLDRLVLGLEAMGIEISEDLERVADLTRYALETRYPGAFEPVEVVEYQEAIRQAESVLQWVVTRLPDREGPA